MEFPNTLVINLDKRPERWKEIQDVFNEWPSLERISAIEDSPGWKGCAKSHLKCIRLAKERRYPWVLILEDDCVVKPDSLERFREILPVLWERRSEWDIFLGGCTSVKNIKFMEVKPLLFSVTGRTTHFCLINMEAYDKILKGYNLTKDIDVFYEESIRLCCTVPYIAVQKPGKSDILKNDVDYLDQFADSEQRLAEFLNTNQMEEGFTQTDMTLFNNSRLATQFAIVSLIIMGIFIYIGKRRR
jgi:GR25 family glycosyltransferase involved in LPS biosynthesis